MNLLRLSLLISLVVGAASGGAIVSIDRAAIAQMPAPSALPAASGATPAPAMSAASRLDVNQLIQMLDQNDVSGAIRQVELGWKYQFEQYYGGKFTIQYLEPEQIVRSLDRLHRSTGKKTALIYAIPTPNHLELILVTPGTKPVHHRIAAANREELLRVAKTFRTEVVNAASQPNDYLPAAKQLHEWLITPLEPALKAQRVDTLILCLGTGLRSLPMAALHDGQQFLVEKYSLGLIPAFNLVDRHPASLQGTKVLAMGASEFQDHSPLPAVPVELTAITRTLWQGTSLLNQDFTVANLKAQRAATSYGIVHLATHAEFLPGAANQSYIQFWRQRLHLTQFRDLELRIPIVQLLVLSACQTALGNPEAELGFAGLAVQSGSRAAIASLWSVSDAGTLVLMTELYRHLKTAPIKAEALRQAQLALLKKQANLNQNLALRTGDAGSPPPDVTVEGANLDHPYYWAAFTLIGNPW
ncbi:CHAT domain-containing protein [Phormidium sp. FACHB-592]|uniref:CHAT domain-containing protein n=1 Tax=Stenomitos frigidus AS-A4 TaxID=2933935 RepID=A0ABV0KT08_9CYAN|nr:CHAT domain-containing protein [Phormidium sp. FACHB-592]MBD2073321.1 CHAT domain-containing protein [Phormidium sp. FACHB-592]